jgi:anti-sigma factor RsiW
MRCEQVRSLLNDYCAGSLSEAMRERVEAHLRGCAACQREAQFVQAIWRGLRSDARSRAACGFARADYDPCTGEHARA